MSWAGRRLEKDWETDCLVLPVVKRLRMCALVTAKRSRDSSNSQKVVTLVTAKRFRDPVICVESMHALPGTAVLIPDLGRVGAIPYNLFSFRQLSGLSCQ